MSRHNVAGQAGEAAALPANEIAQRPSWRLGALTTQLASLTVLLSGDGFESFDGLSGEHKGNVLWLVADLAGEVRDLAGQVISAPPSGHKS